MESNRLAGVMPALVTPFDGNNNVDGDAITKLVTYHLEKNVDGFYLCGTTGQGLWMNIAERKQVLETTVGVVGGEVPVVVHVGCVAPGDATELARHAFRSGASAISSVIPPTYATIDAVVAYFLSLSEAAPDVPLLPYFMGSPLPPVEIMEALSDVPTLSGTKYTGPNMYELTKIVEMGQAPWSVFSGMDEQCVFAAMCGAHGAIGSSVNLMPGVYKEIRRLVSEGKQGEAYELQKRANRIITSLVSYGYAGALKAAIGFLGIECGNPRLPELPLEKKRRRKLRSELEDADFDELSSM